MPDRTPVLGYLVTRRCGKHSIPRRPYYSSSLRLIYCVITIRAIVLKDEASLPQRAGRSKKAALRGLEGVL